MLRSAVYSVHNSVRWRRVWYGRKGDWLLNGLDVPLANIGHIGKCEPPVSGCAKEHEGIDREHEDVGPSPKFASAINMEVR